MSIRIGSVSCRYLLKFFTRFSVQNSCLAGVTHVHCIVSMLVGSLALSIKLVEKGWHRRFYNFACVCTSLQLKSSSSINKKKIFGHHCCWGLDHQELCSWFLLLLLLSIWWTLNYVVRTSGRVEWPPRIFPPTSGKCS